MNKIIPLVLAGMTGLLLGAIFFGGLWWTVRKGVTSTCPAFWFMGSLLLRTAIILAGFYFLSGSHWERFVVCLLGLFVARCVVTLRLRSGQVRLTRPSAENQIYPAKEDRHAT
jgi:F1F0 ATPase subunit 2